MFEVKTIYNAQYEVGLKNETGFWTVYHRTKDLEQAEKKAVWLNSVFPEKVTEKGETQSSSSR